MSELLKIFLLKSYLIKVILSILFYFYFKVDNIAGLIHVDVWQKPPQCCNHPPVKIH